jgi:hypothetical protein
MIANHQYDPVIDDNQRGKERLIFPRVNETRWWNEVFKAFLAALIVINDWVILMVCELFPASEEVIPNATGPFPVSMKHVGGMRYSVEQMRK